MWELNGVVALVLPCLLWLTGAKGRGRPQLLGQESHYPLLCIDSPCGDISSLAVLILLVLGAHRVRGEQGWAHPSVCRGFCVTGHRRLLIIVPERGQSLEYQLCPDMIA